MAMASDDDVLTLPFSLYSLLPFDLSLRGERRSLSNRPHSLE